MAVDSQRAPWRRLRSTEDAMLLFEIVVAVLVTWLLLGWVFDRPFAQADGTVQWIPYVRSSLAAGTAWTDHLYRFGVIGGSAMHDAAGTLPIVQVCAVLGLGVTTTANVLTLFLQVTIAFFSVQLALGLLESWTGSGVTHWSNRLALIWSSAFAPWLGWRLAYGHENLVLGLLPLLACGGLVARARTRAPSAFALLFAAWVTCNALSGLGAQMLVYSLVFGTPLIVALGLQTGTRRPFGRAQIAIVAALVAGGLLAMPRFAGMLAYVTGSDFPREGGLTYSFGFVTPRDWLASVPWTSSFVSGGPLPVHEANLPLGPLAIFLIAWTPAASRRLLWTMSVLALVVILFASDVSPISGILLRVAPPLDAFRVPSRAILVLLVMVSPVAMAVAISRLVPITARHADAFGVAIGVAVVAGGRFAPPLLREAAAVAGTLAIVFLARWRSELAAKKHAMLGLAAVAALGVGAFDERFPRALPIDAVEDGPRALHDRLIGEVPQLASPLTRIEILNPPRPYEMSLAFAAGLSSIDGAWYPTRRFLSLLSALNGAPVDSTTGVFKLGHSRAFPVLQQLYNVQYLLSWQDGRADLAALPATPGPAWFPQHVMTIGDGREMASALRTGARVGEIAWVLDSQGGSHVGCTGGRVADLSVDSRGQDATIVIDTPSRCTLVIAANYVSSLHATTADRELDVFPIDLALIGIDVPAGHAEIHLGPRGTLPSWSRLLWWLGLGLLITSLLAIRREL